MSSTKRWFTIVGSGGRYGTTGSPRRAAVKAARQLFRRRRDAPEIRFELRETTRGSRRATYSYRATIERYDAPVYAYAGDNEIDVTQKIRVVAER